jgi:hypothetical protein
LEVRAERGMRLTFEIFEIEITVLKGVTK